MRIERQQIVASKFSVRVAIDHGKDQVAQDNDKKRQTPRHVDGTTPLRTNRDDLSLKATRYLGPSFRDYDEPVLA